MEIDTMSVQIIQKGENATVFNTTRKDFLVWAKLEVEWLRDWEYV